MSLRVVASSPSLELSGANVLVANLLDRLGHSGAQADWMVTSHQPADDAAWLGSRRFKLHRLPPSRIADVGGRQRQLKKFLEERAPCIYLPNFDFDMAGVIPALSRDIAAVLIMHSDDPVYHQFVSAQGRLFDAIVCVSEYLACSLKQSFPSFADRVFHIPFGVDSPDVLPDRNHAPDQTLEVAYCGRIAFRQKRVQDLAEIINRCHAEKLCVKFHIAGAGPDEKEFFGRIAKPVSAGLVKAHGFLPNGEILKLLERCDVLLMTSDFEGLPVILLEAMSRGCVPVVTRIKSGTVEIVQDQVNGFLLPIGDINAFVATLKQLAGRENVLAQLRLGAYRSITAGKFTLNRAVSDYRGLFEKLSHKDSVRTSYRNGKMILPVRYTLGGRMAGKFKQIVSGLKRSTPPDQKPHESN